MDVDPVEADVVERRARPHVDRQLVSAVAVQIGIGERLTTGETGLASGERLRGLGAGSELDVDLLQRLLKRSEEGR